ncbi:MAG: hypothetical protein P4L90_21815 [Rhodopila sp.]|nr:hypothetical protein [Rhodopila sp.]
MIHPRTSRAFAFGAILAMAASASQPAPAGETQARTTTVRSGNHPGFGRVVIDTVGNTSYQIDQAGDQVVVRFDPDIRLGNPPSPPRNVISIRTDGSTVELTLNHGVLLHPMRMNGRVVLDIQDARENPSPPAKAHQGEASPEIKPGPGRPSVMATSPELGGRSGGASPETVPQPPATPERARVETQPLATPLATQPAPDPPALEVTQQTPPGRDVMPENEGPVGLRARRVKLPNGMEGSALLVPFASTTAAASFRSGDSAYIVFDERRPVDMAPLRSDPVFGLASVQLLPGGTLLRVPLPPALSLALTQMPRGWRIAALTTALKRQPIAATFADGRLNLAAEQSGDVVSLADPDTGATLLVGTQHRPGQGVATMRRSTEFILRPTTQGVVVEPLSDSTALKPSPTGFTLSGGSAGLALSSPTSMTDVLMDAAHLTRRLDFPTMPPDALLRQAIQQLADASTAPPMARGFKHHVAAENLMALGLAAEAESLLHMAAEQDPREAASADTGALTAIAALLAGRKDEADALSDPRLDGSDEIALWRAVRQAMRDEGSPQAAAVFASTAPLVFQYPAPIREHILPLIIETMIQGGEIAPAARLLKQRESDPRLSYARALMRQADGDTDQALTMLDALANGHDQFDRARAAVRAVEVRLAAHKLDKTQAADALDKLLYAWRGDARELALRERVAELRGQIGAWRAALATLRQAEIDFPEQAAPIHERLKGMFAGMIRESGMQQAQPIEFVTMVDENTDLMPDVGDEESVEQPLADRLLALDLPGRAKPVLEKLLRSARSDTAKARFGNSLATLESREGNDAGTLATLDGSEGHDLPPELVEQRTILRANAVARRGDPAGAAAMLVPLHTGHAAEVRAQILENAADWAGAAQAWSECAALQLPESGALDDAQTRTMLRLATATARAGDDAGLATLRLKYGTRIGSGPLGDMFRLLTAEPIRTSKDIQRSSQEVSLAASLPADLKALRADEMAR